VTVTYLVATTGRHGLDATLQSIVSQRMPGDQTLVVGATADIGRKAKDYGCEFWPHPAGNNWGHDERNDVMRRRLATGDYLVHLDDDDVAVTGSRVAMETAYAQHPGQPFIFKMFYPESGHTLWSAKVLTRGNVGTPMYVLPNQPEKLGRFAPEYGGDLEYITSCGWDEYDFIWVDSVIARIRPN
jgi:hypothetical protein